MKIVNINLKYECCFWICNSKLDLSTLLIFSFQTPSEMSKKGIRMKYAKLVTLLNIFKGTVEINSNRSHKS